MIRQRRRSKVGIFSVEIAICDVGGENFEEIEALVDTGATTTVIPGAPSDGLASLPPSVRPSSMSEVSE